LKTRKNPIFGSGKITPDYAIVDSGRLTVCHVLSKEVSYVIWWLPEQVKSFAQEFVGVGFTAVRNLVKLRLCDFLHGALRAIVMQ